jgi:hypothetical protein
MKKREEKAVGTDQAQHTLFAGQAQRAMRVNLVVKRPSEFFWLKKIQGSDISKCCAKSLIGQTDNRIFEATAKGRSPTAVEIDLIPEAKYKAYYICGLSKNYRWEDNTHVAFVPDESCSVLVDNEQVTLRISNAREIKFQTYVPRPQGEYTQKQRTCRNWIFANYLKDGRPL